MDPARLAKLAQKTDLAALLGRLEAMTNEELAELLGADEAGASGDGTTALAYQPPAPRPRLLPPVRPRAKRRAAGRPPGRPPVHGGQGGAGHQPVLGARRDAVRAGPRPPRRPPPGVRARARPDLLHRPVPDRARVDGDPPRRPQRRHVPGRDVGSLLVFDLVVRLRGPKAKVGGAAGAVRGVRELGAHRARARLGRRPGPGHHGHPRRRHLDVGRRQKVVRQRHLRRRHGRLGRATPPTARSRASWSERGRPASR